MRQNEVPDWPKEVTDWPKEVPEWPEWGNSEATVGKQCSTVVGHGPGPIPRGSTRDRTIPGTHYPGYPPTMHHRPHWRHRVRYVEWARSPGFFWIQSPD